MPVRSRGLSLVEALIVVALIGVTAAFALPAVTYVRDAGRAAAGARQIAGLLQALRWESVALRRGHGLLFEKNGDVWIWWKVRDGNGNGTRTAEVRRGTDPVVSGPHRLDRMVERVRLGFPSEGPFPRIPPKRGNISDTGDPVQFGRSNLVGFSPIGNASSGTIYVTDGRRGLCAVVLFGPTARVRVWRYDFRRRRWVL
jgi:type II secretory pathway pseudopilin PulG